MNEKRKVFFCMPQCKSASMWNTHFIQIWCIQVTALKKNLSYMNERRFTMKLEANLLLYKNWKLDLFHLISLVLSDWYLFISLSLCFSLSFGRWYATHFLYQWCLFATPLYRDMGETYGDSCSTHYTTYVTPSNETLFFAE